MNDNRVFAVAFPRSNPQRLARSGRFHFVLVVGGLAEMALKTYALRKAVTA